MVSGNPVAGFWESIGLGVGTAYYGDNWTLQAGMVDAQATADGLDFSSFGKGKYAYMLELNYEPENPNGTTSLSALALSSAINYAAFATKRYSWCNPPRTGWVTTLR